jgi:hypothetical protein
MKSFCAVVVLSSIISSTSAFADECDATNFLKADSYIKILHDKIAKDASSSTDESKKDSGEFKGNYFDVMSSDGTASFERALKQRFQSSEKEDYSLAESYLALSAEGRKAYEACLAAKTQHVFLTPDTRVMESAETFITVRVEEYLDPKLELQVHVRVDGGAKLADDQTKDFKMSPGERSDISVVRELNKPFVVHVKVGKEERNIAVPARETTKLVRELRYSPNKLFGHSATGKHDVQQMCVELKADDDAVLIPGSSQTVTPIRGIGKGGQFTVVAVDEKNYSPKKVCRQADAYDDGTEKVDIRVCAYTVAEVVVRIPINDDHSKYSDPKTYDAYPGDPDCKRK